MIYNETMQQSSYHMAGLPACLLAAASLAMIPTHSAFGQDRYRVTRRENFRREPGPSERLLASVNQGTVLVGRETRDGWVQVTLDGWIWRQSLRPVSGSQFDFEVSAVAGENLRDRPNGAVVARLSTGLRLEEVRGNGEWVRVQRPGWMWGRSLERVEAEPPAVGQAGPGGAAAQRRQPAAAVGDTTPNIDRVVTLGRSALRLVPGGDTTAVLGAEASMTVLTRSGEWVRVRTEGWVHESDLRPVSSDVLVGVSGAEVRAQPEVFEGRVLEWIVQYLALRTSDGLRRELPEGQRYMLARGPLPEAGFVYVLLGEDQSREIERLSPLAELVVLARVRVGRTRYLANPVIELIQMSVRER